MKDNAGTKFYPIEKVCARKKDNSQDRDSQGKLQRE
jgi:hypothetical protein